MAPSISERDGLGQEPLDVAGPQAEIVRAHGLDLVHRDAAGDPRQVLGEGQAVHQLLALAEPAGLAQALGPVLHRVQGAPRRP